ncbi:MAG: LysM peptidoglycan-binding domain-containing protein [Nitratireductor sp.]|nr:LysM peptidoglycan-binding domain-containing protein [Nitratireductor sp.]
MNKSNRIIAWLMAGAAAVGAAIGGGYYASRTGEKPAETASAPSAPAQEQAAEPAKPAETASAQPETAESVAPQGEAQGDIPTFSVLRVEKDGSAVVAGSAKPDTKVELVAGGNVIASTQAGPSGDFAIVLDQPLAPGAHELSLRATDPAGAALTSQETGIVNVPQGDGELVAMVAKPGEASRVMQAGDQDAEAAIAAVEAEVMAEQKSAAAEAAAPAGETAVTAVETTAPAGETAASAGTAAGETQAAATQAEPAAPDAAATQPAQTETAAAATAPAAEAAPAPAVEETRPVLVSAVDFEDGKIYIAGTGEPGRTVNIYLDGTMTGSAVVGPDGAFLLEAPSQLEPGEHTIRADLLSSDGSAVAARAEVPLVHEAPTEVAAAEQKPAGTAGSETVAAQPEQTAAAEAPAAETNIVAAATEPGAAQTNAAASAEVTATGEVPAATAGEGTATAPATEETAPAASAGAATQTQPAAQETAAAEAPAPAMEEPAASEPAAAAGEPAATETVAAPAAVEQEPITTGASVIIRRGDNLWRISRRMLGKGIRYTTIYEANRDQIKNPSLIYPGQVFQVPGATSVN